jgi:hypothetical protein
MEIDLSELACGADPFGLDVPRDSIWLGFDGFDKLRRCTQALTAAVDSGHRQRDLLPSISPLLIGLFFLRSRIAAAHLRPASSPALVTGSSGIPKAQPKR